MGGGRSGAVDILYFGRYRFPMQPCSGLRPGPAVLLSHCGSRERVMRRVGLMYGNVTLSLTAHTGLS